MNHLTTAAFDISKEMSAIEAHYKNRRDREKALLLTDGLIDYLAAHIADGGTLIQIAEQCGVSFGSITNWIGRDEQRQLTIDRAYEARNEWAREKVLSELRLIAHADPAVIYRDDGTIKPFTEWPPELTRAIESVETGEYKDQDGQVIGTYVKRVKFHNKLKGLELLGKTQALFVERVELTQARTLQDIIAESWVDVVDVSAT